MFRLWHDAGTHYRSHKAIGHNAMTLLEAKVEVAVDNCGLEKHMKDIVDQYYSILNHRKNTFALKHIIASGNDLVEAWTQGANFRASTDSEKPVEYFEFFMPTKEKQYYSKYELRRSSLPVGIQSCHSWSFKRKRPALLDLLDPLNPYVAANVEGHANILPDTPVEPGRIFTPKFKAPKKPAAPGAAVATEDPPSEEEDEEEDAEPVLLESTQIWLGWRISYRKQKPEEVKYTDVQNRLSRKEKAMRDVLDLDMASRHKPIEARRAAAAKTRGKKNEYAKRVSAALKLKNKG